MKRSPKKILFHTLYLIIAPLSFFFLLFLSEGVFAQTEISRDELVGNPDKYDSKQITYIGEVIGDIMERGDYVWLNVKQREGAIGVWAKKDLAKDIRFFGGYNTIGDKIEVIGIFNRACLQHGGETDIHALDIRKISSGEKIKERMDFNKTIYAVALLVILCIIWISTLFIHR